MEEFRTPQREVVVEILLQGGQELTGTMFVPVVGIDTHPVPLVDRLNDNERFMPLARGRDFEMINKSCIVLVRLKGPVSKKEQDVELERHLSLELDHGAVVEGVVRYVMPPERSRLLDFLNVAPRFIQVESDNLRTLVNSDFILRILACSPDPA